ncbi:MAG: GntR family transcriptional regulator [Sphingomonas bacterium]
MSAPVRESAAPAPRRSSGQSMLTLPERIADDLGGQIANGIIPPGERLREVEIAKRYGVSRAPVREAVRILARRHLVDFQPRRGAFAIEVTIERLVDIFNVMAHLNGLAARYFALLADEAALERSGSLLKALEELAEDRDCDPQEFAFAAGRVGAFITRNCGSAHITEIMQQQLNHSLWSTLWRNKPIDFFTFERRREAASLTRRRHEAFLAHDPDRADEISRRMTYLARDHAVAAFSYGRRRTWPVSVD